MRFQDPIRWSSLVLRRPGVQGAGGGAKSGRAAGQLGGSKVEGGQVPQGLTVQGQVEDRAIQATASAHGQVVAHGAVEAGIPVGLPEPQVEGAGERLQARSLPDRAAGHVALWEKGGGGQRQPPAGSIPRLPGLGRPLTCVHLHGHPERLPVLIPRDLGGGVPVAAVAGGDLGQTQADTGVALGSDPGLCSPGPSFLRTSPHSGIGVWVPPAQSSPRMQECKPPSALLSQDLGIRAPTRGTSWAKSSTTDRIPLLGKTSVASGFAVGEMLLPSGAPFRGSPLPPPSGVPADTHRTCGALWWPRCSLRPPSPRTRSSARLPPGPQSAPGGPGSPAGMGGCGPGSRAPGPGARSPAAGLRPGGGGPQSGLPVGGEGLSRELPGLPLPLCPAGHVSLLVTSLWSGSYSWAPCSGLLSLGPSFSILLCSCLSSCLCLFLSLLSPLLSLPLVPPPPRPNPISCYIFVCFSMFSLRSLCYQGGRSSF